MPSTAYCHWVGWYNRICWLFQLYSFLLSPILFSVVFCLIFDRFWHLVVTLALFGQHFICFHFTLVFAPVHNFHNFCLHIWSSIWKVSTISFHKLSSALFWAGIHSSVLLTGLHKSSIHQLSFVLVFFSFVQFISPVDWFTFISSLLGWIS